MQHNENPAEKNNRGLYIHWPFCLSLCPYCDFNRMVKRTLSNQQWKDATIRDIQYAAEVEIKSSPPQNQNNIKPNIIKPNISSIFFGGGTPSLADPSHIDEIISAIKKYGLIHNNQINCEITLEANPTSIETAKLNDFKQAGINRISLGIQSLKDNMLQYLGRNYDAKTARNAIETALNIFPKVNLDFIYARTHNENIDTWLSELNEICSFGAGHLSLYRLTPEPGTPFYRDIAKGKAKIPNENNAAKFLIATREKIQKHGYNPYEISNFAKDGQQCNHNLIYWNYGLYAGIGAGAHGRTANGTGEKYATVRPKSPKKWHDLTLDSHRPRTLENPLTPKQRFNEKLIMGLRLYDGIPLKHLKAEAPQLYPQFLKSQNLQKLTETGYIKLTDKKIAASHKGILALNSILERLIL